MLKRSLLILLSIIILISAYFTAASSVASYIKSGKDINILFVLNDFECSGGAVLKFASVQYSSLNKEIKILFIDENITILQRKKKSRTLKEMVLATQENDRIKFITKEIENLLNNKIKFNYYFVINKNSLSNIIRLFDNNTDKKLYKNLFETVVCDNNNIYSAVCGMKILSRMFVCVNRYIVINMIKHIYNKDIVFDTNFTLNDFLFLYDVVINRNENVRFADIPTIRVRNRIEVEEYGLAKIIEFLTVKNKNSSNTNNIKVEVLNSSAKPRLAIKAVNELRKHNFDIFEWGTSHDRYDFTIILDLADDYEQTLKIKQILGCGEILFRPDKKAFADVSVFLGSDCNIYDKLDRQENDKWGEQ